MERFFKRLKPSKESSSSFVNQHDKVLDKQDEVIVDKQDEIIVKEYELDIDNLPSDPGMRPSIMSYPFEKRDQVRIAYLLKGPCQPRNHKFPQIVEGNRNRKFVVTWFDEFKDWLEYSIEKNAAFCLYCYLFSSGHRGRGHDAFVTEGFNSWRKKERLVQHVGDHDSYHNRCRLSCQDLMNQSQFIELSFAKQFEILATSLDMEGDFVKELVWSLKPEFQEKKFSKVEKVLKNKLFRDIVEKKKENDFLKEKCEVARCDKLKAEREVEKLTGLNSQLIKERNELTEKLSDDKKIIVELHEKVRDLECEKLRAKSELDAFKKRFEELETQFERLQNELESFIVADEQMGLMDARVSKETNHLQEKVMPKVKTEVDANGENHLEHLEHGDNAGKKNSSGSEEVENGANCRKNNEISAGEVDQISSSNVNTSMDNAGTQEKKVIEVDVRGRNKRIVANDLELSEGTASHRTVDKKGGIGRPSMAIINIDTDVDSSSPKSTNVQEMAEKLLKRKRCPAGPSLSDTDDSSSSSESEDEPDMSFDLQSTIKIFKNRL